jgi:heat shock protein HtpX
MTLLVPIRFFEQTLLRRRRLAYAAQTVGLLVAQLALLGASAWFFAGPWGVLVLIAWVLTRGSRRASRQDTRALERLGARSLPHDEAPGLRDMLHQLAKRAGLSRAPALFILPDNNPNALAMGSPHEASLGLTIGLIRCMDERELTGIVAHEIAHIRQRDTALMRLADTTSQLTLMLARLGVITALVTLPLTVLGLAPISGVELLCLLIAAPLSLLLRQSLSRVRELQADLEAVRLTQDAAGLASALIRLDPSPQPLLRSLVHTQPTLHDALRTHPATAQRIAQLQAFERARLARIAQGKPHVLPLLTRQTSAEPG